MPNCLQCELTGGICPGIMSHYASFKMQIAAADSQAFTWASSSASTLPERMYDEHTLTRPDFIQLFQTPQTAGFDQLKLHLFNAPLKSVPGTM